MLWGSASTVCPGVKYLLWVTDRVVYVRFHGSNRVGGGRYDYHALRPWALRTEGFLEPGRDVYAYFKNDA